MLILCRRTSESLKIGDEVTVTVMDVRGSQVRFGIDAPRDIPVHREEIYERIKSRVEEVTASSTEPARPAATAMPRLRRRARER